MSMDQTTWNFARVLSNAAAFVGMVIVLTTFLLLFYFNLE